MAKVDDNGGNKGLWRKRYLAEETLGRRHAFPNDFDVLSQPAEASCRNVQKPPRRNPRIPRSSNARNPSSQTAENPDCRNPRIPRLSQRMEVHPQKSLGQFPVSRNPLLEDHRKLRALFIASCKVEHAVVGTHDLTREAEPYA